MNKELMEKTREWMELERKTQKQREKAEEYYDTNLMKLIEEDFIERNKDYVFEKVRHLVVSVGTSYEPIVLNISLLEPDQILFLYTEKSKPTLDKIVDYTGLKASAYEKRLINELDPIDIYQKIKDAYIAWEQPEDIYIDFTGGTKAMSAAAALAGAMIGATMIYVASEDYLVDFRKPNPGSECLTYIENPLAVFGDIEIGKAFDLYAQQDFAGAAERLETLKEDIPDPVMRQELGFDYLISRVYEAWDALDFSRANEIVGELNRQLKRDGRRFKEHPLVKNKKKLDLQTVALERLGKIPGLIAGKKQKEIITSGEIIHPLMFTMHMNAMTREGQQKYDMATLLFYRLLEMIEQRRLSLYNLYVSDMRYEEMKIDKRKDPELAGMGVSERLEWLKSEMYNIKRELFRGSISTYLPNPVSLLDGFIILAALGDEIFDKDYHKRIVTLKQTRSKVFLRNNSIFAHGLGPVSKADYSKFRDFVIEVFKKFCDIEKIDYEKMNGIFTWISLNQG
ncbi:MAG: TIGR02710 family CRISPR-associated protein [Lachnospiraceae bacterium]|nr:TIGR02710 family CRISPR-associated protein [Lachnospiraceae bacterium]